MRAVGNLKECSRCRRVLALTEFAKTRSSRDGLQAYCNDCRRDYYEQNRQSIIDCNGKYYGENREKRLTDMKPCSKRHYEANRQRKSEQSLKWHKDNPEAVRRSEAGWKKRNHDRVLAYSASRRAREAGAVVGDADFKRIWKRDRGVCYLCGRSVDKKDVHYDHVVPLSRGGAHSEENLRVTHGRCNLIKGAKLVEELDMSRFK